MILNSDGRHAIEMLFCVRPRSLHGREEDILAVESDAGQVMRVKIWRTSVGPSTVKCWTGIATLPYHRTSKVHHIYQLDILNIGVETRRPQARF